MKKITALSALIVCCLAGTARQKPVPQKPNVIIVLMDDMGYGDLEEYGGMGYKTPNLTKLANNGMRFTSFYSPQGTCTASRAALMTGTYPNRISMYGAFGPNAGIGLHPNETTVAEMLKSVGYATAMIGKWHLGNEPEFLPTKQGFDEYLGLPYSNDMWPVSYDGKPLPPNNRKAKRTPPLPMLRIRAGQQIPDTAMIVRTLDDQAKLTTIYTEKAVDYIKKNKQKPFFLYLAHSMTHAPIAVSSKFKGKSEQGLYGDVMMEVDWSVQQIVKTLKEQGIDQNTLIVFTSDNGPWLNFGDYNGTTAGLREGKGTSWEGGTREPCIMSWPSVIPKGVISNKLMCSIDILPTLAAVTGAKLPPNKIDGVNMLPVLEGKDVSPRTTLYYYYHKNDLEAVRMSKWKLVFPHKYRSYEGVMPGQNGLPGPYNNGHIDSLALYDLRRDPGERYNVISLYPEKVAELQALAEKAREDLGDNLTKREGKNRRSAGMIAKK